MPHFTGRILTLVALVATCICADAQQTPPSPSTKQAWLGRHLADYDAELRGPDGRVDTDAMANRLKELGVTTYYWLVWHAATDWEDLKLFLPKAAEAHIQVWVYLVPPTESPPHDGTQFSEPFRLDYGRWAEEIARLSLQHTNLTGWIIDDFYANHEFFTPEYVRRMQAGAKHINPRLAFLPLMYFNEITPAFMKDYRQAIDGVVAAYPQDTEEIRYARSVLDGESLSMPGQLSCPWSTPTSSGDFVSAVAPVRVLSPERCRLRFSEWDDFTGATSGYHFKQLLVDNRVAWEEDAAGGIRGWHDVEVDISPWARGKTNIAIAFRLLDKKGVSNFGLRWRLRDLRAAGLQLPATLNNPEQWRVEQRGPFDAGFGEALQKGAPAPQSHIPFIVMTAASPAEFRLRHGEPASAERIADWVRMSLQAMAGGKCDGLVTYSLDKRPQSATFPLVKSLLSNFGR